jgi:hypothetical protein
MKAENTEAAVYAVQSSMNAMSFHPKSVIVIAPCAESLAAQRFQHLPPYHVNPFTGSAVNKI